MQGDFRPACASCGGDNETDSKFCRNCGSALTPSSSFGGTPALAEEGGRGRLRELSSSIVAWIVLASLWTADRLIQVMLTTRSNERRIRPTERVTWPKGMKQQLMRRQDNTCVYCGYRRTAPSFDIDHIIPVVRGGPNDIGNLQVICRPCNQRKGLQTDQEFRTRYSSLVPSRALLPPPRRISQREYREETRRTVQGGSVQQFRRTRFISKGSKVSSGCMFLGVVVAVIFIFSLALVGAEGYLLLLPPLVLGGAAGLSVWLRAYRTGAMIEDGE